MTAQVLHSPSHFSSSSSSSLSCAANDNPHQNQTLFNSNPVEESEIQDVGSSIKKEAEDQLSLLAVFLTVFRKSLVGCSSLGREEFCSMEIGWPTNVQHVAHVTFDRFNGFLGLPVEFEPEVPRRAPSASANVFGVSTESMQCSYDSRGNSVPTILLLMQRHLYAQGGLQAEGIFRINADNSQEEYVRDQLNRGLVPDGIDVHCLAGLIKAWFRELPAGILDSLTPEQVMECQSEDECAQLARLLPPTESALLDWAVNLMADVVQEEHHNKMNAHNIAMVFAPNMTQMADPLTALMYAVQVMNFLKTLVVKALGEREDCVTDSSESAPLSDPSDENGHHSPSFNCLGHPKNEGVDLLDPIFLAHEPVLDCETQFTEEYYSTADLNEDFTYSSDKDAPDNFPAEHFSKQPDFTAAIDSPRNWIQENGCINYTGQSSNSNLHKGSRKDGQNFVPVASPLEKSKGISIVSRINSRIERVEAWR